MKQHVIVLYLSKTGFTKWYAECIAEELNCSAVDIRDVSCGMLSGYDTVVFGGRAHAGRLAGLSKARKLFEASGAKHLMVFATGATPMTAESIIAAFWENNFMPGEIERIPHFYMQSGLRYESMGFIDKLMMKGFSSMLRKKKELTDEEKVMAQVIACSFDDSSRTYIQPLVDTVLERTRG